MTRKDAPPLTVLMAVKDGERHLPRALASVIEQTYGEFEFVVVNDGSTDGTAGILAACADPRLTVVANERCLGLTRSLNRGLARSRGRLVARMDADDVCLPFRLERQVEHLEAHPEIDFLGTWTVEIDDGDVVTGGFSVDPWPASVAFRLAWMNVIYHPTLTMRREALDAIGGYDESLPYAQDHDLVARAVLAGRTVAVLPERLLLYRRGAGQVTKSAADEQARCGLTVRRRYLSRLLGEPVGADAAERVRRLLQPDRPDLGDLRDEVPLAKRLRRRFARDADARGRDAVNRHFRDRLLEHAHDAVFRRRRPRVAAALTLAAMSSGPATLADSRVWRRFGRIAFAPLAAGGRRSAHARRGPAG